MLPAPSLKELRTTLQEKPAALIGILFAPPFSRVGKETIVPRLGYLDARSGQFIHFFCAGYFGYGDQRDGDPICEMRYENGTVIPWSFSQRQFAGFLKEIERVTSWRYSGESDLILVEPRFNFSGSTPDVSFSQALVYNIEAMLRDGAIDSAAELFEAVMRFAREHEWSANVNDLSDSGGTNLLGDTAIETIFGFLPKPARTIWKKGLHCRVQNLAR